MSSSEKSRSQASVELVLIASLVLLLSIVIIAKFVVVQESVINVADLRQELVSALEGLDHKYALEGIQYAEVDGEIFVEANIDPLPTDASDLSAICAVKGKIQASKPVGSLVLRNCIATNCPQNPIVCP